MAAVMVITAYGLLLGLPVFIAMLAVASIPLGTVTLLLPLGVLAAVTLFLPFGFGNRHVARLLRGLPQPAAPHPLAVQLTLTPRVCSGIRALLEDADDFGWLAVSDSHLLYEGDAVQFAVPLNRVRAIQRRNIGFRGLFVSGSRIRIELEPALEGGKKSFEVAERSTLFLPRSRRVTAVLFERLSAAWKEANTPPHDSGA